MGVLEYTGEQPLYVPDEYLETPSVLGERQDMRGDTGFSPLTEAVSAKEGWFLYGQPFDRWDFYLPRPELLGWGNLASGLLIDYWRRTDAIGMSPLALYAAEAVEALANQVGDGRVMIFRDYFGEWARDDRVSSLVDAIQHLLGAHHESNILRDDAEDAGVELYAAAHRTEVRIGFSGAIPLLVIERSYDEQGVLMRCVEVVKTSDPKTALAVLNELSLAEEMRVRYLSAKATPEARRQLFAQASRATIQRDSDVRDLLEGHHRQQQPTRWQRSAQYISALINRMADSQPIRVLEQHLPGGRKLESDAG